MNILVIGGTGFIGAHVIRRLAHGGHDVAIFHRGQTKADFPPAVRHIFGDRANLSDFADEFRQFAPRVILDITPYTEQDARAVMNTFRGVASRLVSISSQDVYRSYGILWKTEQTAPNATPITEDAPLRTVLYPYRQMAQGESDFKYYYDKILVEQVVMSDVDIPVCLPKMSSSLEIPTLPGDTLNPARLLVHPDCDLWSHSSCSSSQLSICFYVV